MKSLFNKSLFLAVSLLVSLPVMSYYAPPPKKDHVPKDPVPVVGGDPVVVDAPNATVTIDGIKSAGEYTGGVSNGSKQLLWWNGHHSIYTKAANNKNALVWEINENGKNDQNEQLFSFSMFFEVPTYARRMIWADGCDYNGTGNEADCDELDDNYLDSYLEGAKDAKDGEKDHHDSVKMDYKTQTESEYFQLNNVNSDADDIFYTKWQNVDSDGLSDGLTWKTSREYLIANNICSTTLCQEYDMTSSVEIMWSGLASQAAAMNILNSISDMELHLSDEARGLPPVNVPAPDPEPIPEPSALVLFAMGLIGFRVFRKVRR